MFLVSMRDVYGNNGDGIKFFSKRTGNLCKKKMYLDNAKYFV